MVELDAAVVEVFDDGAGEAGEGFGEGDVDVCFEVCAGAGEDGVVFLIELEDDVAGFLAGDLVCLAF